MERTEPQGRYFTCPHCGYNSIVKDTDCPICLKDGLKIKMI